MSCRLADLMSVRVCINDDSDVVFKADLLVLLAYDVDADKLVARHEENDLEVEELKDRLGKVLIRIVKRILDLDEDYVYTCVEFNSTEIYEAIKGAQHVHDLRDILLYYVLGIDLLESIDLSLIASEKTCENTLS